MFNPKKILLGVIGLLIAVFSFFPQPLYASQNKYFDYGPYYSSPQVLGFSLSNLENLPALQLPENLKLPKASGILPDSPFYTFEKVIEGAQLAFTFDPVKKEALRLEIASERLAEAKTLMDQGKTGAASKALDDYGKTLTEITEHLPAVSQSNNPATQSLLNKAEEVVAAQTVVTAALSLTAPPAQAENWTDAGVAGKSLMDKVADLTGEPAIPDDLSTGLQSLKEQGLISEEETNKLYGLKNRSEVREELNKLTSSGSLPPSELIKLDEAVARYYPEVQNQQITNFQVVELRSYQTLPQPEAEVVKELQKWQENPGIPPSNDIKPYLWYNRAEKLASAVNLSNFSESQQNDLVKLYPRPVVENPTYSPPPSPVPSPTPSATPTSTDASLPAGGTTTPTSDQPATPAAQASAVPSPTPPATAGPAEPYLQDPDGALPGQPTYILKQIGEGFNFAFTFDPAEKAKLRIQHAERRLAEAEALSNDPKKATQYESALANYQTALNDAASYIKQLKDTPAAKRVAEQLEAQASRHEVIFEKGLLPPPAKNPKLISDAIKATEDAMDRSADKLDRPALPRILSSRLDDLKAQGLILSEEAEDLVNSSSREEVREKIRKLVELKTFPLADAKKLDEAQTFSSPADFNQLVEVRKVEELQNLRSVQTDLAQTPTLRTSATNLSRKEAALTNSIDPAFIKPEDLAGRDDLVKTYQELASTPRPINGGQFGPEATPGAQITTPGPTNTALSVCPEGAVFKKTEGCIWADNNRQINDYDQYKCGEPGQYYSFAVKKCVSYDGIAGFRDDAQPVCPVSYTWSWYTQSCTEQSGNPIPSPSPEPQPEDEEEIAKTNAERSKYCPEGSSYKVPRGCVWDNDDKPLYDPEQYRCRQGQYYSFNERKCIAAPKENETYPDDVTPACKEPGSFWSWNDGKCIPTQTPSNVGGTPGVVIDEIKPSFVTPDSPFYFLKQAGEAAQLATAFSGEAREQVRASQARERLAESYWALQKGRTEDFNSALGNYTIKMQELYNDLSKSSLSDKAKKAIGEKLAKEAVEQNLILQKIEVLAKDDAANAISAASSTVILGVDKAADLSGEAPLPDEIKTKIESLPEKMISEEDKKELLAANSRVEIRLKLGEVAAKAGLTADDTAFLNEDFDFVDTNTKLKIGELKKLKEITSTTDQKEKLEDRIEKNEEIITKLAEFQKDFEPGKQVPSEIRPYVRLTRIEEITQTIRPDIVKLEEFQNRKDLSLAIATLQEEFKPTRESFRRIEEFRRRNPNIVLPPDLARIEALSYSLGVRNQAETCYLPTPPFPANTPCPPPGAAIQIASYANYIVDIADRDYPVYGGGPGYTGTPAVDKDGKPLVYGEGPKPASAGVCLDGFHWMYDSGGWCMSNSGNYSSSSYPPSGSGPGYTPYSPYYTAPGAPSAGSSGYPVGGYSAPSYYGSAPTYYTTTPPAGTVPGSGPKPSAPGQCPSGFHWMSDSGGWCMSDAPTYVPSGPYSPNLNQSSCGPGYYWDGKGCIRTTPYDTYSSCQPPSSGCGSNSYWDYGSCSCRGSSTYSDGGGTSSGGCSNASVSFCASGWYFDYAACTCRTSSYSGSYSSGYNTSTGSCTQRTCGSNEWFDWGTCSCRPSGNTYSGSTYSGGSTSTSSGSCPTGSHWMSDNGGYCMSDAGSSSSSGGSTSTTSSGSSTSGGSCPSGYHWMSDSGGWCMQDGSGSTSTSTSTTSSPTPSTESTPPPSSAPSTESTPPPSTTESAPPPAEPAPPPSSSSP